jgi:hypothetical protein
VTHERYLADWYGPTHFEFLTSGQAPQLPEKTLRNLVNCIKSHAERDVLFGEVGSYLLPHVEFIRGQIPCKVVWMTRKREDMIRSFCNYFPGGTPLRPFEKVNEINMERDDKDERRFSAYSHKFPAIDGATAEQTWGFYYDYYHAVVEARVSEPLLRFDVEDLNDDEKLGMLFDFLEIPEADREYLENRKHNTIEDAMEYNRRLGLKAV